MKVSHQIFKTEYRADIDGLRGIAVLSVVFYHAGFASFQGGFAGVDVFFVISGYLISKQISRSLQKNHFSFAHFYSQRALRIFPALFLVLSAIWIAGFTVLTPFDFVVLSKGLGSVLTFCANFHFLATTGYFEPLSDTNPLIHLWSLAIEEQFYLLLPFLLVWLFRQQRSHVIILALALGSSLCLSVFLSSIYPSGSFYLLHTRAWELLVGVFLFRSERAIGTVSVWPAYVFSILGLGMILGSIIFFNKVIPYPSYFALLPAFGAAFCIFSTPRAKFVQKILSFRPLVGLGVISYSLYLWHQPVFAYTRQIYSELDAPSFRLAMTLICLNLALAIGTWKFVEQPFRRRKTVIFRHTGAILALMLWAGALGIMIFVALASKGIPQRFDTKLRPILADQGEVEPLRMAKELRAPFETPHMNQKPKLLVVGDSFANDVIRMLIATEVAESYQIRRIGVPYMCQIHFGLDPLILNAYLLGNLKNLCADYSIDEAKHAKILEADVVIFSSRWREWAARNLSTTLENLQLNEDQKVFVIGSKNFQFGNRDILSIDPETPAAFRVTFDRWGQTTNAILEKTLPEGVFVNIYSHICFSDGCPIATPDGRLISPDGSHFHPPGAKYVGDILFSESPLNILR